MKVLSHCYPLNDQKKEKDEKIDYEKSDFEIELNETRQVQKMLFESITCFQSIQEIKELLANNSNYIEPFIQECKQAPYYQFKNQIKLKINSLDVS